MFLRAVASTVITIGLCLPQIASAHPSMRGGVQHGDVTYYYSANGRLYAKEIENIMYYKSSPEYLVPGYTGGDIHPDENAPYYRHYLYQNYSPEHNAHMPTPYYWDYVYRVR